MARTYVILTFVANKFEPVTAVLATTLTTTLVNVAVGVFQGLMGHLFKPTDYQDVKECLWY